MSQHHKASKWTTQTAKLRALIKPSLPLPCRRCGKPVDDSTPWVVGHIHDLALDPEQVVGIEDVWPEHSKCSARSGGQLSQALRTKGSSTHTDRRMPTW